MRDSESALSGQLVERVLASHPVPIADAVAALAASSSVHEERDRVVECFRAIIRYASALALSARVQYGPGPDAALSVDSGAIALPDSQDSQVESSDRIVDRKDVVALLRALRGRGLTDGQWVGLYRSLLQPWARVPSAHPLPALVELFHGGKRGRFVRAIDGLLEMRKSETVAHGATGGPSAIREVLRRRIPQLAMLLEHFEPVWQSARLVVPVADNRALVFMGDTPGRDRWRRIELDPDVALPEGQPVLIDDQGRPVLALAPIALIHRPSPDAAYELFVLDGARRRRAVYVAIPSMAEHCEVDAWRALDRQLSGARPDERDEQQHPVKRPYRGLASFDAHHIELFFGRDRETETLANRIRQAVMITVTGPSGCGKTSLLRAGVAPTLSSYQSVFMRPGNAPMRALRRRLIGVLGADAEAALAGDAGAPAELCRTRGMRLLLCIDQTEELFTLCRNGDERYAFTEALAQMISAGADGPIRVVLSIRGDFFAKLATLPALAGVYSRHVEVITTPGTDALRDILIRPAQAFGYQFEDPKLVAAMLAPLAGEPAALAMLQFAADRMWELRDRSWQRLTWDAYEAIGGVEGALTAHADAVLDTLTISQREIARTLLLRLVTSEGTRAVVDHRALLETAVASAESESVLGRLVEARLVVVHDAVADEAEPDRSDDRGGRHRTTRVELIHEALLARWQRLRGWLDDDREALRVRDRIAAAAVQWVRERAASDYLLAEGKPLAEAEALLVERIDLLQPNEIEFIQASQRRRQRRRMWARLAVTAVLSIAVAAIFAGLYAWAEGRRATRAAAERKNAVGRAVHARMLAQESQESAQASAEEAAVRANEAALARARSDLERDPTASLAWLRLLDPEVATRRAEIFAEARLVAEIAHDRGVARDVLLAHPGGVAQVAFRADGQMFASGSRDGQLAVWDVLTIERRTLPGHGDEILDLTFSPDGSYLASVGADATVRLNRSDGSATRQLAGHNDSVTSVAFAPDGDRLATGGRDRAVLLWDLDQLDTPLERFAELPAPITDLAFSHNGVLLALADGDGGLRIWNQATGETTELTGPSGEVGAIAFSPDNRALAAVASDRTVFSFDLATGEGTLLGRHKQPALTVAFSADGDRVLTAGNEHNAYIWPARGGSPEVLRGHTGALIGAHFARADNWVVSASSDRSVRTWPIGDRAGALRPQILRGHGDTVTALAISPDGRSAVSGARDGELRIWHLAPTSQVLDGHRALVNAVAISADGRRIATAAGNGDVTVWRAPAAGTAASPSEWPTFVRERDLSGHTDVVHHVAFASGSELLASASGDGTVRLWSLDSADASAEPRVFDAHRQPVWYVEFAPDDDRLVSAGDDGTARIWQIASDSSTVLGQPGEAVVHAVFSPDGRYVATASWDHQARVWDSQTGRLLRTLSGHRDAVTRLAWSPDGSRLASGSADRSVHLYLLSALDGNPDGASAGGDDSQTKMLAHTDEVHDLAYARDGSYLASASNDRTVRVWPTGGQGSSFTLRGHDDAVTSVVFAADSRRLVSASKDGAVRVWDLRARGRSRVLRGHVGDVNRVVISADGRLIVSAGDDRSARVWRAPVPSDPEALTEWLKRASHARWNSSGRLHSLRVGRTDQRAESPRR